jgi:hypothetical protein
MVGILFLVRKVQACFTEKLGADGLGDQAGESAFFCLAYGARLSNLLDLSNKK